MNPLAHVVALIILLLPIWDVATTRRMRAARDVAARTAFYWQVIAVEWPLAVACVAFTGLQRTFVFTMPAYGTWRPLHDFAVGLCVGGAVALAASTLVLRAYWSRFSKQIAAIDYLLPKTRAQRILFFGVSVTAGVCEEIIFRAFALAYLITFLPAWPLGIALLATAVLFGVCHAGQGPRGVAGTAALGFILGVAYVGTGLLATPIVLHVILDARFCFTPNQLAPDRRTP